MFFSVLLIFFLFSNSTCIINSDVGKSKIPDNSSITLSLVNYNVASPEGESLDSLFTFSPYTRTEIIVTNIPDDAHFIVMQSHSYLVNVTLSFDSVALPSQSITGTNVGLVKLNQQTDMSFYLIYNSSLEEMDVMLSIQAYSKNAPIPGGCNMEFQVEVSPFLLTTYNKDITEVSFAPSAPPLSNLPSSFLLPNNECNIRPPPVHHKMYKRYFPERDFTRETYFSMLKSMMTLGRIRENGVLVPEKPTGPPMKKFFATYAGTGIAFVVVSYYENYTSVYVPSFSYGCCDLKDENTCLVLTTTFSKVLCATVLFLGLFACFFGHYFFRIEIFLFGFLASGIIVYILVSLLFSSTIALSLSVSLGIVTSTLMLLAWTIFGLPIISVTIATLTFGFLLASIIYYPILDFIDFFVLDINFWGIFIGIVVSCPIFMLYLAEKANIISCAFLGSYVTILSIDHYIGSNLRYIVINTIRRAVVEKFEFAIIGPPFQFKDILLCFSWAVLLFSGIAVQRGLMRNKPPYPPPLNPLKSLFKRWKRPSSASQPSERTSLLRDALPNSAVGSDMPRALQPGSDMPRALQPIRLTVPSLVSFTPPHYLCSSPEGTDPLWRGHAEGTATNKAYCAIVF